MTHSSAETSLSFSLQLWQFESSIARESAMLGSDVCLTRKGLLGARRVNYDPWINGPMMAIIKTAFILPCTHVDIDDVKKANKKNKNAKISLKINYEIAFLKNTESSSFTIKQFRRDVILIRTFACNMQFSCCSCRRHVHAISCRGIF
jgi:hypothetical protein